MLTHLVLGAHIILLYFLERALRNITSQLSKIGAVPTSTPTLNALRGGAARERSRAPTIDELLPDKEASRSDGFVRPAEWEPLTADELRVIEQISAWLGPEEARRLPYDTLVTFVRGYAYRVDWAEASFAYLDRCLKWRRQMDCARILDAPPPDRARMERYCAAGPIGFDADGHVVEYQGIGSCPPDELLQHFDEALFIRHACYSRECMRLYASANSAARGRRLYKVVSVLDLAGFGMGHMKILNLLKTYNALFAWHYPESIAKFVVINAPLPFTAAWRVIKGFMHPITVQKVHIVGSNFESYLADIGVELPPGPAGDLRQRVNGWHAELDALLARPGHDARTLQAGYAPPADVAQLRKLGFAGRP